MEGGHFAGWGPVVAAIREDVRLAHTLRFAGRRPHWWSRAWVLLASRGVKVLVARRCHEAAHAWVPAGLGGRLARRAVLLAVNVANRVTEAVTKSEISRGRLEGGVYLSDGGHIIIGARSIGAGTVVHDHVTIGRGIRHEDVPEIGRNVWIGPRCVVYGKIRVGDGATLLPGTVLSRNVPPCAVLHGNPAEVLRREFDNTALRGTVRLDRAALPLDPGPRPAQPAQGRSS